VYNSIKGGNTENHIPFDRGLDKLLRRGVRTNYAGGFLFTPYIHWFSMDNAMLSINLHHIGDIPVCKWGLLNVNSALLGIERIYHFNDLKDRGLAILSGLSRVPDQSSCHRFLEIFEDVHVENLLRNSGKRFVDMGEIVGDVVSLDSTSLRVNGDRKCPSDWHGQIHQSTPLVKAWYSLCHKMQNPIWVDVTWADVKPAEMRPQVIKKTKDVTGRNNTVYVFDRGGFRYDLFHHLTEDLKVNWVALARYAPKKVANDISLEAYKPSEDGRKIAATTFDLGSKVEGAREIKIIAEKRENLVKPIGYMTNVFDKPWIWAIDNYRDRQYIENMIRDGKQFYHLDKLPGFSLPKIRASLTFKMIANNIMSAFKHEVGFQFYNMTPKEIYRKFVCVPGFVRLDDTDTIVVTLDKFKEQKYIESIYQDISSRLTEYGLSAKIPWLNNYPFVLKFGNYNKSWRSL